MKASILEFTGKLLVGCVLAFAAVFGLREVWQPAEIEAPEAAPAKLKRNYSIGKCHDGAIRIHDVFSTCPHPNHAVRVRSSLIIACVCKSSTEPDPEETDTP